MHVLIQFELLCQKLSDLRTGCSRQGDGCCREDMSRILRRKNEAAGKEEKKNEQTKKKKLKV